MKFNGVGALKQGKKYQVVSIAENLNKSSVAGESEPLNMQVLLGKAGLAS